MTNRDTCLRYLNIIKCCIDYDYIGNYDDFRIKIMSSLNFTINGNIFIHYRM